MKPATRPAGLYHSLSNLLDKLQPNRIHSLAQRIHSSIHHIHQAQHHIRGLRLLRHEPDPWRRHNFPIRQEILHLWFPDAGYQHLGVDYEIARCLPEGFDDFIGEGGANRG